MDRHAIYFNHKLKDYATPNIYQRNFSGFLLQMMNSIIVTRTFRFKKNFDTSQSRIALFA